MTTINNRQPRLNDNGRAASSAGECQAGRLRWPCTVHAWHPARPSPLAHRPGAPHRGRPTKVFEDSPPPLPSCASAPAWAPPLLPCLDGRRTRAHTHRPARPPHPPTHRDSTDDAVLQQHAHHHQDHREDGAAHKPQQQRSPPPGNLLRKVVLAIVSVIFAALRSAWSNITSATNRSQCRRPADSLVRHNNKHHSPSHSPPILPPGSVFARLSQPHLQAPAPCFGLIAHNTGALANVT